MTLIDLPTNCVAVIFRVKVACIASVDDIKIWLNIDLIGKLSHNNIGHLLVKQN